MKFYIECLKDMCGLTRPLAFIHVRLLTKVDETACKPDITFWDFLFIVMMILYLVTPICVIGTGAALSLYGLYGWSWAIMGLGALLQGSLCCACNDITVEKTGHK